MKHCLVFRLSQNFGWAIENFQVWNFLPYWHPKASITANFHEGRYNSSPKIDKDRIFLFLHCWQMRLKYWHTGNAWWHVWNVVHDKPSTGWLVANFELDWTYICRWIVGDTFTTKISILGRKNDVRQRYKYMKNLSDLDKISWAWTPWLMVIVWKV